MKKIISLMLILCFIISACGCSAFKSYSDYKNVNASDTETENSSLNSALNSITSSKESQGSQTDSSQETESPADQEQKTEPETFDIKLSFSGDTMIASFKNQTTKGSFNEYAAKKSPDYFLADVQSVFAKDDFTTVNLENVLTDNKLKETEKDHDPAYWFYSKTENVKILTEGSVEGVSIANNHTYDYGYKGYLDTTETVKKAGLKYGNYENIMYYEKNGYKIAVICYGLWRSNGVPIIKNLIKKAEQKSDYQIIYFHGGKERIYKPEEWKVKACHDLVDAGADLVIGNHPHVLQPREVYNGVEIVYSLGNFLFGGNKKPGKNTIIYQMTLTVDTKSLKLKNERSKIIPCYVYDGEWNDYQPLLITDKKEKAKVISFMDGKTATPY